MTLSGVCWILIKQKHGEFVLLYHSHMIVVDVDWALTMKDEDLGPT